LLTLLISGGVCLGLLSAPALRDHLQMAREEIIPRAAKQAEIVSRSRPVRRKNRKMGADPGTHPLPGILDGPGTAGCHWQPEHGHKSNGDFTLLRSAC
jgi:hypothetical protein